MMSGIVGPEVVAYIKSHGCRTACVIGPTPISLGWFRNEYYDKFQQWFTEFVRVLYAGGEGINRYVTSGVVGVPELAFFSVDEVSHEFPVRNDLFMAYEGCESDRPLNGKFNKMTYANMMTRASSVTNVVEDIDKWDRCEVDESYVKRNQRLVDEADIVIALYNETDFMYAKGSSVAAMMARTIEKEKAVIQLSYLPKSDDGLIVTGCTLWESSKALPMEKPKSVKMAIEELFGSCSE